MTSSLGGYDMGVHLLRQLRVVDHRVSDRAGQATAGREQQREQRDAVQHLAVGRDFCHSAAPPSPFCWCFKVDIEGMSVK